MAENYIDGVNNHHLRNIIDILNTAKEFKANHPEFLQFWGLANKTDNPVTDAKNTVYDPATFLLSRTSDRTFPLETVELQSFNQKQDKNIESAVIHVGPSSDEIARSNNLLAFVMMDEIFFRSNKFNTTTEEGRKLLRHELTHVAQNKNKSFKTVEELEQEAERAEYAETVETDPAETVTISGKNYKLRKNEQRKIVHMTADYITNWVEKRKYMLDEEEYLKLILDYKEMVTGFEKIYDTKTEADCWMEQELKKELRWMAGL